MSYLGKVAPGQPLEISAQAYNLLMDMARDYLASKQRIGGGALAAASNTTILIKNASGSDCARFDILGVSGVVIDPADSEAGFLGNVVFSGDTPSSTTHANGKFCILAEPIANGKIGRAWTAGTCHAWVNIVAESDTHADLTNGDASKLTSGDSGPCVILWKESGTGDKWAIIRFGGGRSSGASVRRAITTEAAPAATNITCNLYDSAGNEITSGEGSAIEVYCSVIGGGNLNAAVPRLEDNDDLWVVELPFYNGSETIMRWFCVSLFQASQDCT